VTGKTEVTLISSGKLFGQKRPVFIALALMSTAVSIRTIHAYPRRSIPTTLCEVLSHPAKWDNKVVSISASYLDGVVWQGPVLADDRCENGVMDVAFTRHTTAEKDLDSSIPRDSLGTFDHSVQAIWTVRFHSNHGKFHETFLDVQTITNLSVSPMDLFSSDASPISTSVDEIVSHPRVFNHKKVAFHSEFMSDGMHGSMVFECGLG